MWDHVKLIKFMIDRKMQVVGFQEKGHECSFFCPETNITSRQITIDFGSGIAVTSVLLQLEVAEIIVNQQ